MPTVGRAKTGSFPLALRGEAQVGDALDRALSQPVIVTKHGKPENVVLSYDEYERLIARATVASSGRTTGAKRSCAPLTAWRWSPATRH
ncbi:MAG: type II toxin-antitoxin system Phd/YefM family antitoxin [Alphaproteobacteria bacterium]|nr:type II toxin-antitoxin system Phd/YefM family antitoxin [Alphaproteobacteria bacterium]